MNDQEREICIIIENIVKENIDGISDKSIFDLLDVPLQDMNITSISFIKIIVDVEREFDFEFDDEYLTYKNMNNLRKMVSVIDSHIAASK